MGFYIRKGFNFGPLRLNLSRSGLGASFGITGARIGIKPTGSTYVHVGRAGLYYRQTLTPPLAQQHYPISPPSDGLQEIASASAANLQDSSAGELLQELNRVQRRRDVFPFIAILGTLLLLRMMILDVEWWLVVIGFLAICLLSFCARHYDVTNGSVILNYSLGEDERKSFAEFETAFKGIATCAGFWHIDASAYTSDWKRNAGAGSLNRRSTVSVLFSYPPKVSCNIAVPVLKVRRKSFYFFPDRLLLYDSTGVGCASYSDVQVQSGQTRFIESESVPADGTRVGITWRFVNRDGGPDRRFNGNRQYPIMLYGELFLRSSSGLNDEFQCSMPAVAGQFGSAIASYGKNHCTPTASTGITFATPPRDGRLAGFSLWAAVVLLLICLVVSTNRQSLSSVDDETQESQIKVQEARNREARQEFARGLEARLELKHKNLTIDVVDDELGFRLVNEGPNAARFEGLTPFAKQAFFKRFIGPTTESELCDLGFRVLSGTKNHKPAFRYPLACPTRAD
jgi:hypothetical protein